MVLILILVYMQSLSFAFDFDFNPENSQIRKILIQTIIVLSTSAWF
jgi:hypothetical protein